MIKHNKQNQLFSNQSKSVHKEKKNNNKSCTFEILITPLHTQSNILLDFVQWQSAGYNTNKEKQR